MPRMTIIDGYQATCSAGIGAYADEVDVDAVPPGTVSRDGIAVPMMVEDSAGALRALIVTGWTDTPPTLYIDNYSYGGISGPCTLRCSPSQAVQECTQPSESQTGTINATTYTAECGCTHYVGVQAAGTISLQSTRSNSGRPFGGYTDTENHGHRTTIILTDTVPSQPTITWTHDASALAWENGAPQFTSGKTRLVVEVVGDGNNLLGWFRLFA